MAAPVGFGRLAPNPGQSTAGPAPYNLACMPRDNPLPKSFWILLAVGLSGLALAGYSAVRLAGTPVPRFHGTPYADAPPASPFALVDHRGDTAALEDHRGRAVLLFFGFTRCPDACPLTLNRLTRILDEGGIGPDRASILLVTVDPEHDTPERLSEYVTAFGPAVTGLTGDMAELRRVYAEYGVYAQPGESHQGHASIAHTTAVFGIDPVGRLRVLIQADQPAEVVEADIRTLLRLTR